METIKFERNGEGRKFKGNLEGNRIDEMHKRTVLGIIWSSDFKWRDHLEARAISQIKQHLSQKTNTKLRNVVLIAQYLTHIF